MKSAMNPTQNSISIVQHNATHRITTQHGTLNQRNTHYTLYWFESIEQWPAESAKEKKSS